MSVDFDWMQEKEDEELESGKKIYGVVTGTVLPFAPDPLGLGRIRVELSCIDSVDPIAWARVAGPTAGLFHGAYFIPNAGDSVLICFEHGDVNVPYIIGALWNLKNLPPVPLAESQIRTLRTRAGAQVVFEEIPEPTITIQAPAVSPVPIPAPASPVGPYSTLKLSTTGIDMAALSVNLKSGSNSITIDPTGIVLQVGGNIIQLTELGIYIQSLAGGVTVEGAESVSVTSATIKLN